MSEKYRQAALFTCALSTWDLPVCVLESTGGNMATQFSHRLHINTAQTHLSPSFENRQIVSGPP